MLEQINLTKKMEKSVYQEGKKRIPGENGGYGT